MKNKILIRIRDLVVLFVFFIMFSPFLIVIVLTVPFSWFFNNKSLKETLLEEFGADEKFGPFFGDDEK